MFNYMKVIDSVVVSVMQSSLESQNNQLIAIDNYDLTLVGKRYINGEFIDIAIREITAEAFRNRFKFEEKLKIEASQNPAIKVAMGDLMAKQTPVNLDSPKYDWYFAELEKDNCFVPDEGQTIEQRKAQLLRDGEQGEY